MRKYIKNTFLFVFICLTVACKEQLYTGLTEKEANQMQALLLSNDVNVSKEMDKSGNVTISVEKEDFVRAITILNNNGFPKKKFADIEVIFSAQSASGIAITRKCKNQLSQRTRYRKVTK
ncbi:T3SS structure protein EscJ [Escherichia coli]|nr:T3SS structure protein EscJ [Escherichia coli]